MNTNLRSLALVALATLASAAMGCSAAPVDGDTESSEDAVTGAAVIGDVAAVRVNGGATVATEHKVRRILANVGLNAGAPAPQPGAFRCMPSYHLELLKADGQVAARAGFMCGGPGSADRINAQGSVQIAGKSYLITAKSIDAIDAIAQEPLTVGDALFGAESAKIVKNGEPESAVPVSGTKLAELVRAIGPEQVPDEGAASPRCPPAWFMTFSKGGTELAQVGLPCEATERGAVAGRLTLHGPGGWDAAPALSGGVTINAGAVFDIVRAGGSR